MHKDDDFILDIDESRSATTSCELTGWELLIFEIADAETDDRGLQLDD